MRFRSAEVQTIKYYENFVLGTLPQIIPSLHMKAVRQFWYSGTPCDLFKTHIILINVFHATKKVIQDIKQWVILSHFFATSSWQLPSYIFMSFFRNIIGFVDPNCFCLFRKPFQLWSYLFNSQKVFSSYQKNNMKYSFFYEKMKYSDFVDTHPNYFPDTKYCFFIHLWIDESLFLSI